MKLRVRVLANRKMIGEAVAAAIQDDVELPVVADSTDPTQEHKASQAPNVVIVVGSTYDASTSAAVRTARRRWRQAVVIALADSDRVEDGVALVQHGADTWLSPRDGLEALRAMLARVGAGERILLPQAALGYIASSLNDGGSGPAWLGRLTSREIQVLELVGQGQSRSDIAARLAISRATLRTHIQNILLKLELHSIDHAAALVNGERQQAGIDRV